MGQALKLSDIDSALATLLPGAVQRITEVAIEAINEDEGKSSAWTQKRDVLATVGLKLTWAGYTGVLVARGEGQANPARPPADPAHRGRRPNLSQEA